MWTKEILLEILVQSPDGQWESFPDLLKYDGDGKYLKYTE